MYFLPFIQQLRKTIRQTFFSILLHLFLHILHVFRMKKEKTLTGIKGFLSFLIWMTIFGFFVRLFETALLAYYHFDFQKQFKLNILGFGYDILWFGKISLSIFPIHLLISHFDEKAAKWTLRIIGTLMLLISNAMVMYFVEAYLPLDKIFFDYSISDIIYIAGASEPFVWWGYVFLLLIPAAFFVLSRHEFRYRKVLLPVWTVLAIASLFVWKVPERFYENSEDKNTIGNKQAFFFGSLFSEEKSFYQIDTKDFEQNRERIKAFQSLFFDIEFVDERYPFAHIDKSPDVLSPFFNLNPDQKPNLVFIITEGLGREFCGKNSQLPSPMPFLDSLASAGLSWDNCLSSSQRTFAVLPTMFGSLPFGEQGFLQSPNCPRFNSMIKTLNQNGYSSSFFYGGWLCFDEMCYFLNDNGVNNFLPDYTTYPQNMMNSWGLYDEYLFSESFKHIDFENKSPRLDIYMTLTTHDPFEFPCKENYIERYKQMLAETKCSGKVNEYTYKCYASFSYFDDCLRKFFSTYKSKPGYENTIFVITGDHCFYSSISEFNKYYVPLVIWSPMLKESKEFPAMATHRDITPSFLAMMKSVYGIETPDTVAWINSGLDTVSYFRSKTFSPQLKGSRIMSNMIFNDMFYDDGKAYKITCPSGCPLLTPCDDNSLKNILSEYKALDDYVMNKDALLPGNANNILLASIDSMQSQNFTLAHTKVHPADTLGESNVFSLCKTYPFEFFEVKTKDELKSVSLQCELDVFIPKHEECSNIHFDFAIDRKSGHENIKSIPINYFYQDYGQWHHFSMTQIFEKSALDYQDGDKLSGYFVNEGNKNFFITNFRMKIIGTLE